MRQNAKVYVFEASDGTVKVGHSRAPERRVTQVSREKLRLAYVSELLVEAERVERLAHRLLAMAGKRLRGEWFSVSAHEAIEAIDRSLRICEGLEPAPVVGPSSFLSVNLSDQEAAALDRLRKSEPDLPSRSEMVRRLIERSISKVEKGKK